MITPLIDIEASLAATSRQTADGAVKVAEDLDRYEAVIAAIEPEVIIECGTWLGGSAAWFAKRVPSVITVDIEPQPRPSALNITWLIGDSTDRDMVAMVAGLLGGRRTMVVLDSAHEATHVRREIALYAPLVTPGCHLVVEDGIARWMDEPYPGSPLDAIEQELVGNDDWQRDTAIEAMHPVSMHPAGWWIRKEPTC